MVLLHLCSKIIFLTKIQKQQGQRNKQMVFKVPSLVIVIIYGPLLLLQVNLKVFGRQVSKTLDLRPSHHNKIVVKLAKLHHFPFKIKISNQHNKQEHLVKIQTCHQQNPNLSHLINKHQIASAKPPRPIKLVQLDKQLKERTFVLKPKISLSLLGMGFMAHKHRMT